MRSVLFAALIALAVLATPKSALAGNGDTYNLRISPVTLLLGYVSLTLDTAVSESWTVGPTASYWHLDVSSDSADYSSKFKIDSYSFGARANWFANGTYSNGIYFGPSFKYASTKLNTTRSNGEAVSGSANGFVVGALLGYGWFWNSFNMMLGLGYGQSLSDGKISVTNAQGQTTTQNALGGLDGEFSFGWTF